MKPERLFYPTAGAMFLVLTVVGFQHYIFGGKHFDGSPIDPTMLAIVVTHSSAIFVWFVLFFVQSLLISVKNRGLHMKLGWSVLVIGTMIAVTGPLVAYRSIRLVPTQVIFDWPGPQFLLIMYAEIVLFVVLNRKRPRVHRPMMLMASLSILSGATGRIPLVGSIFGMHHWMGTFGRVVALGGILLLVRMAMTRSFEQEFAVGVGALVMASVVATELAVTDVWVSWAGMILKCDGGFALSPASEPRPGTYRQAGRSESVSHLSTFVRWMYPGAGPKLMGTEDWIRLRYGNTREFPGRITFDRGLACRGISNDHAGLGGWESSAPLLSKSLARSGSWKDVSGSAEASAIFCAAHCGVPGERRFIEAVSHRERERGGLLPEGG